MLRTIFAYPGENIITIFNGILEMVIEDITNNLLNEIL